MPTVCIAKQELHDSTVINRIPAFPRGQAIAWIDEDGDRQVRVFIGGPCERAALVTKDTKRLAWIDFGLDGRANCIRGNSPELITGHLEEVVALIRAKR